ncbi:MAG: hypothetical protein Tsb0020_41580 [Haliangiales bacterium]
MPRYLKGILPIIAALVLGCGPNVPSDTTQVNTTDPGDAVRETSDGRRADVLSAYFGLDGMLPARINYLLCKKHKDTDGMPLIFSDQVDLKTLQAGDIRVTTQSGAVRTPECVTFAPALDTGELRTALLLGEFGDHPSDPPVRVEVTGHVLSLDGVLDFKGAQIDVTPLPEGPTLLLGEVVPMDEWKLGAKGTQGAGSGCPEGTTQIVRAVWTGGITRPGGDEIEAEDVARYKVTVEAEDGTQSVVTPFAVGDLNDRDNNHKLCLDMEGTPVHIAFPAGFVTDPNEDLNPDTQVAVTP